MYNLFEFFSTFGEVIEVDNTHPISLNETEYFWLVTDGYLDLFSFLKTSQDFVEQRNHLHRFNPGQILMGFDYVKFAEQIDFIGVGVIGTSLIKIKKSEIFQIIETAQDPTVVYHLIEEWVKIFLGFARKEQKPKIEMSQGYKLNPGLNLTIPKDMIIETNQELVWFEQLNGISLFYNKIELNAATKKLIMPFLEANWLYTKTPLTINCYDTKTLFQKPQKIDFTFYQEIVAAYILQKTENIKKENIEKLAHKKIVDQSAFSLSQLSLISVTGKQAEEKIILLESNDLLFEACNIIAKHLQIKLIRPKKKNNQRSLRDPVNEIASASKIRVRKLGLVGKWWQEDAGPILLWNSETQEVFSLIPSSSTTYSLYDLAAKTITEVTPKVAKNLPEGLAAYMFYRSFPNKILTIMDIIKFGIKSAEKRDLYNMLFLGFFIGVLTMALPFFTSTIMNYIIPNDEKIQLYQIVPLILAINLGSFLFQIVRSIAMQRYLSKIFYTIQTALWDRLLCLPVSFFRKFSSGDITNASLGINTVQTTLFSSSVASLVDSLFSAINILILFYYSVKLSLVALAITLITIMVTGLCSWLQITYQRQNLDIQGKLNSIVLEIINGIGKFRIAGAENRIFKHWADNFATQKNISFKIAKITNYLTVYNSILPIFSSMILYYVLIKFINNPLIPAAMANPISMGNFMGFIAAFTIFLTSMTSLTTCFVGLLSIKPTFDRIIPILNTEPEIQDIKSNCGELSGVLEIKNLCFAYDNDSPQILRNISFKARPGEFLAIVGESGCGKSTLLRLLLGFEKPQSGNIYYDDLDLNDLDIIELRSQLGVVLQNGQLLAGDIFSNIVGSANLTMNDAWEAARLAGLEKEIFEFPMGMHTFISEQSASISGGQKQRILIARALAKKPKIIFFDEATSALDNITQTVVCKNMDNLKITKIIIAQRLSTIINADRIIVLNKGEIVQVGNFKELITQEGYFADLAKRQMN
ncbi:MAG: NHLP bacteriocin export ABC transporter permease/ATPase subunit [Candidatus Margulisiibacteriota bacterium]|jgi:NHLM bacteriocin system ABC transporter ATP-binding protein